MAVVIARALGPEGRGQFAFASNLAGLVALILSAGASAALVGARRQRAWDDRMLLRGAMVITALSCLPVLIGALVWQIAAGVSASGVTAGVAVPLIVGTTLATQAAQIRSRFVEVLSSVVAGPGLALVLVFVLWSSGNLTVLNALVVWLVTMALGMIPLFIPLGRRDTRLAATRSAARRQEMTWFLRNSLSANIPTVATLLIWRLDILMIQWFKGDEAVGQYSIAVGVAETIMVISIGLRSGLVAHLADLDKHTLFDTLGPVFRAASAAMLLVSCAIAVFAPFVVGLLFGNEYEPAISSLRLLVLGIPFLVLHYPLVDLLVAVGKMRELAIAALSLLLLNFGLNAFVLSIGRIWMVAGSASVTYALLFLWVLKIVKRDFPVTFRRLLWPYTTEWSRMLGIVQIRRGR